MKRASSLHFESNGSMSVAHVTRHATDAVTRRLQRAVVAIGTWRNGVRKLYRMRGDDMLNGPLADEYRRASWL